jgi:hypothetical protein
MRTNELMRQLWPAAREVDVPSALPGELQDLIDAGWTVGPGGALVLAGCYGDGSGWRSDWKAEEVSRHELEVNDVAIPCGDLPEAVVRAKAFAGAAMEAACGLEGAEDLVAVVSVGVDDDYLTHGATVKFATERGGLPAHFADLERFRFEAMALVEAPRNQRDGSSDGRVHRLHRAPSPVADKNR